MKIIDMFRVVTARMAEPSTGAGLSALSLVVHQALVGALPLTVSIPAAIMALFALIAPENQPSATHPAAPAAPAAPPQQ